MLGLYIHVPFCVSKCPYCDFYSLPLPDDATLDAYTAEVCRRLERLPSYQADTLYFGGGTPSLLGGTRLARIVNTAKGLASDAEITLEANPADELYDTFAAFAQAGGNRISLGMQAANDRSLQTLGRRHTTAQLHTAVADAHRAGIDNLSLDIMLATPSQTEEDLLDAVREVSALGASHVSAYLLKIEPDTPFYARQDTLNLPDEDTAADRYWQCCEALQNAGYAQYEISNFAKEGKQSRHNLKYWNSEDYIGIGPAAHSFYDGKRWYYERSFEAFMNGASPIPEDPDSAVADGSEDEYAMLRLRLTDGLRFDLFEKRFGHPVPTVWKDRAVALPRSLVITDNNRIALTREGFLLSNALTARII